MYLFDDNVVRQKGENLFFDLDVIIQKNIDDIANFDPEDCLCFGQTHWHDLDKMKKETSHRKAWCPSTVGPTAERSAH